MMARKVISLRLSPPNSSSPTLMWPNAPSMSPRWASSSTAAGLLSWADGAAWADAAAPAGRDGRDGTAAAPAGRPGPAGWPGPAGPEEAGGGGAVWPDDPGSAGG